MNGGFLLLGACTIVFSSAVAESTESSPRPKAAPTLLRVAGVATLAAGLMRRDRMLLGVPDEGTVAAPSWHNRGHDLVSAIAYACMIAGPAVLGGHRRARGASLVTAILLTLFASRLLDTHNGVVQRLAVTIPLVSMGRSACSLLRQDVR
ncbi:hypothetical protein BH18ACT15_BH18ACT15_11010 [soil metagenome]